MPYFQYKLEISGFEFEPKIGSWLQLSNNVIRARKFISQKIIKEFLTKNYSSIVTFRKSSTSTFPGNGRSLRCRYSFLCHLWLWWRRKGLLYVLDLLGYCWELEDVQSIIIHGGTLADINHHSCTATTVKEVLQQSC